MEKLRGVVERITYTDEEKGFSVIKVKCKNYSELVTFVGNISSVNVGSVITAQGNWSINPKFGRQFNVEEWEESLPADIYGIEKYLGSGLIRGVGPKFAKLIVNTFKEHTIDIIENEPLRLLDIPNIGRKRIEFISSAWQEHKDIKNIMIFLQKMGVSTAFGYRIYKAYGEESINKIKENPYDLADNVYGIGFKTADTIAMKLGISKESYNRCRSGVFYTLNKMSEDGHCYAPLDDLIEEGKEILDIDHTIIVMTFSHLRFIKELICEEDDNVIYLPPFYFSEVGISKRIKQIIAYKEPEEQKIDVEKAIGFLKNQRDISYDYIQIDAIKTALTSKISVITGGPGVGKTTITKAIIDIFKQNNKTVLLTAPTGRAAKRMSEVCGIEAKTIHRLLECSPMDGFGKNTENKLTGDVLIIDEASMIDLLLMYNLLKAVPDNMKLIIVGDVDQLPSVGPGNVLNDIIESGIIPVIKLTHIYRQAAGSSIITNSHKINKGEMPRLSSNPSSDFFFIEENRPPKIIALIRDLCCRRLPKYYNVNPISDIEVLTPMKRGETGTDNLNGELQRILNPNGYLLRKGAAPYRLGDKVMQIKNNYDKDVFNGNIGIISSVDVINKTLTVDYEGHFVNYDILELEELSLSYAITIHKSQGGEFPIVVMPFTYKHMVMLQRNLLYTGITRAKKALVIVGERDAIKYAVENDNSQKRRTLLAKRLQSE